MTVAIERLRELFSYDPETGIVTRKHNGRVCGVRGGQDYIRALVDGELLHVHRIAFALYTGRVPEVVDHIDRDKRNNRAANLRDGTQSDNTCNRPNTGGVSRFKGVHFDKQTGKWRAEVKKNGVRKRIGRFDSEEEAAIAYDEAAKKMHGSFAGLNYE